MHAPAHELDTLLDSPPSLHLDLTGAESWTIVVTLDEHSLQRLSKQLAQSLDEKVEQCTSSEVIQQLENAEDKARLLQLLE